MRNVARVSRGAGRLAQRRVVWPSQPSRPSTVLNAAPSVRRAATPRNRRRRALLSHLCYAVAKAMRVLSILLLVIIGVGLLGSTATSG